MGKGIHAKKANKSKSLPSSKETKQKKQKALPYDTAEKPEVALTSDDDDVFVTDTQSKKDVDAGLLDEVRAFAAELGFGPGGGDNAFDEFDPSKAKKKVKTREAALDFSEEGGDDESEDASADEPKPKKAPLVRNEANDFTVPELSEIPKNADKLKSVFLAREQGMWYELVPEASGPPGPSGMAFSTAKGNTNVENVVDDELVASLRERASKLLEVESIVAARDAANSKDSSVAWLQQAKQGGTTTDKVAAMAVLVQEHPIAHLKSLEGLVAMVGKRGGARAVVGTTLDAMVELWKDVLLPPHRKLKYFYQQPLHDLPASSKVVDRCLVAWEYEDRLKSQYATFVERLEMLSTDNLDFIKERATKTAFQLLLHRSEQEGQLLKLVVNKLGDPERKAASNAGYMLTKLLAQHSGMKHVVVREIENFIYRPGLKDRARYYAVVYLNQIVLSSRDAPRRLPDGTTVTLGKRLVDIYFTLFKLIMEGKLGTAASIAQAKQEKEEKRRHDKATKRGKKKFVGGVARGRNTGADAKSRGEEQQSGAGNRFSDRQGTMDSRMLSALITGIRRAFPYVASEEVEPLIDAHSHSLFKLVHTGSFGVATQALLLLYQLMSSQSSISDRFYRALYAALLNKELPVSTKAPLFLSLFLKAVKDDVSINRSVANVKRLLQVALGAQANFACGCLIVVSEILKASPALWNTINDAEELDEADENSKGGTGVYDPSKRDPQYAHAEHSCLWELLPLSQHAHPSVSAMAKTMLAGVPVQYNGDPLKDFVLSEFLSKFISKKKKPKKVQGGDSYMQPTAAANAASNMLESFEKRSVAPDEAFLQKFFEIRDSRAVKGSKRKAKTQEVDVSDDDSSLAEDDFLAGEEGDDATFGDVDGPYDYDQLAAAMQEDEMDREDDEMSEDVSDDEDSGKSSDDASDMGSLEGAEFSDDGSSDDEDTTQGTGRESDVENDDDDDDEDDDDDDDQDSDLELVESDVEDGGTDGDDVFASLEDYQAMIDKDLGA
jgi:ribosome biogenesis protein MAK21